MAEQTQQQNNDRLQSEAPTSNKRIAKNALMLYIRMFLTMIVGLYTSRVVLNALGVEDYGIYNVVGSIVALFSILTLSLSQSISRFLTIELGRRDFEKLNKVFCTSLIIQSLLALTIIIFIESLGWWLLNNKMQIPPNRVEATTWVLHLSAITSAIGLICVPYNALIIAHEHMSTFARFGIFEAFLKLSVAVLLTMALYDRLIIYAILMALVAVVLRVIYGIYSHRHFEESRFHWVFDKNLFKDMFGFAGWNFIGASSVVLRDQGGNVLLNMFFGPTVNAARGIAWQVYGTVFQVVSNIQTAFNPQITKSFAAGNRNFMLSLIFRCTRFSFFALFVLSLPLMLEAHFLLKLWLKIVPEHTAVFTCIILLFAMSESLAQPIVTGMLASGRITKFQLIAGGIQLMNLPIAYIAFRFGAPSESVFIIALIISQISLFAKLILVKPLIGLNVKEYISQVYLRVLLVVVISTMLPLLTHVVLLQGWGRLVAVSCVSVASVAITTYFIGFNAKEREYVTNKVHSLFPVLTRH